jgi:hypothetical protein
MMNRPLMVPATAAFLALAFVACQESGLAPVQIDSPQLATSVLPANASALGTVDIDSNGDCEASGVVSDEFEDANVRVAINRNWINATCQVMLDESDLLALGGPFNAAQVYRDFLCLVGNDDDLEDVVSTSSHAVVTPAGRLNITCNAPLPSNGAVNVLGTTDIDSNGDCEVEGVVSDEFEDAIVNVAINGNWIIATCHTDLDEGQIAALGGPFRGAQVYRDFECLVGNDDDLEDVVSTSSHAVVTLAGRLNIACKAPLPAS